MINTTYEDIMKAAKELGLPKYNNPFTYSGIPVFEVKPRVIPIIQVSEYFADKWLTDEAKTRINNKLANLVGCREEFAVPRNEILMWNNSILARPEHIALFTNTLA